jgi:hypothetical protein
MHPPLTYLCSPYTSADPAIRQARFEAACKAAAELVRSGKHIYSPIVSGHPLCQYELPSDWSFWRQRDLRFLAICDEVLVLKLSGWQQSVGIQAEIAAARALGKPVTFLSVDDQTEENPGLSSRGE